MNFTIHGIGFVAAAALAGPLMAAGPLVTPAELNEMLADGKVVVLDVRGGASKGSPEVYAAGHVPGAIYAPMGNEPWRTTVDGIPIMLPPMADMQTFVRSLGVDTTTPVVIYSAGLPGNLGDVSAATRAYWSLKTSGHDRVSILDGGMAAWNEAGYTAVSAATMPGKTGNFRARFQPQYFADLAEVEVAYASGSHKLLDARPLGQYDGSEKSGVVEKAGTIPGAVNAAATALMDGNKFMAPAQIRAKLAQIGLSPSDPIITFCNGGYFCSAMWFAAHELAGFSDMQVFDGSMAAWTKGGTRDVVPGDGASLARPMVN